MLHSNYIATSFCAIDQDIIPLHNVLFPYSTTLRVFDYFFSLFLKWKDINADVYFFCVFSSRVVTFFSVARGSYEKRKLAF